MACELIRRSPGDYRITGIMKGTPLLGSVTKISDGAGWPWMWHVGYRMSPRDRGTWHKGSCKNLRDAKAAIAHAVAHMNATEYSPDNREK